MLNLIISGKNWNQEDLKRIIVLKYKNVFTTLRTLLIYWEFICIYCFI